MGPNRIIGPSQAIPPMQTAMSTIDSTAGPGTVDAGSPAAAPAGAPMPRAWHPLVRIGFRFCFVYFALATYAAVLSILPLGEYLAMPLLEAQQAVVVKVGAWVFGVSITVFPNGSGDTTYNWVEVFLNLSLAAVATLVWSALDRRRRSYPWLLELLRIALRFVVAAAMFGYGINKLFKLQFPAPSMARLTQAYGDSSPMGLLWTFMGASDPYTRFAGAMELLGGLLLCFRHTAMLGALVTAGVMTNVVMMNLCYDVPVKLYSSHLLLMCCFLLLPDLRRLLDVFVLNRPAPAADLQSPYRAPWFRWTLFGVKCAVVLWLLVPTTINMWQMSHVYGDAAPRGPMDGAWKVARMTVDGAERPPLVTDELRWRDFTLVDTESMRMAVASPMTGANRYLGVEIQADADAPGSGTLRLLKRTGGGATAGAAAPTEADLLGTLRYRRAADGALTLEGTFDGHAITVEGTLRRPEDFLLMNRGFHWINEYPFNR
ncbi:MAG: hypothetical protein U0625_09175 [Phycisphaerales bacterium]